MTIGCYVINLDRSPERLEHFRLQAAREGLEFQRISAVDGSLLEKSAMDGLLSVGPGHRRPGPGEMGCYLSHRKAWTQLLHDGFDCGFVAEDDVHLANASRFLKNSTWLPAQFDLIKADTFYHLCEFGIDEHLMHFDHTLRRLKSIHPGTAGYFISRQGAVRLLGATEFACGPIDEIMFNRRFGIAQSLITYQLDPAICVQDDHARHASTQIGFNSTIGPDRTLGTPAAGSYKIWRELLRSFKWILFQLVRRIKTWSGVSLFKRVKFAADE